MSKRVLLLKPFQPTVSTIACPPLGLLYLASSLRQRFGDDIVVDVLDMKVRGLSPQWLTDALDSYRPDIVGVTSFNYEAPAARALSDVVKAWDCKTLTILGGPFAHHRAEEILDTSSFDWVIEGEAERVFAEALARHFSAASADATENVLGTDLPGLAYRRSDGTLHVSDSTDSVAGIDSLPHPAWDLVDFDLYASRPNMNNMLRGQRYAPLFTSRGCPYLCNYCHDIFGKKFRNRSAENVLEEIELLHEQYGVDEFQIVDDIFNLHKPRLKKIMNEVHRRWPGKLKFCFPNGVRSDILDGPVLDALALGGTYSISVAIETVSERLQQLTDKHLDIDKAFWAVDEADKRGIMVRGFFMLGFPTETEEELRHTVQRAIDSRITLAHFFTVTPQPGTPLYDLALQEGPEALAVTDETSNYHAGHGWYEEAYGFPLSRFVAEANMRFYGSPRRLLRVLRRVPWQALPSGGRQLLSIMTGRSYGLPATPPEQFGTN